MFPILLAASAFLSFALSWWLTIRFAKPQSIFYIADLPNARSLHSHPVSRSGGIALLFATYAVGVGVFGARADASMVPLGAAGLVLGTVAFVDDRRSLAPGLRLLVHVLVAIGLIAAGLAISVVDLPGVRWELTAWVSVVSTVIWIVWMINLYNFMDGMDGYAGGMTVVGFAALAALGWVGNDHVFVLANTIVAAAALGFLLVNFPPARIFMGDTGSSTLGCFAAAMVIWGSERRIFPLWIGVLVFSPFIVDATVTLLRRFFRGETVWEAHATHYYQRLVRSGWSHRRTVLLQYVLMLACSVSAFAAASAKNTPAQWGVLGLWVGIYVLYFAAVARFESRLNRSDRSSGPIA